MTELGCQTISAYLMELDKSDDVRKKCELLLTVSISRFFRDREFWQSLEKKILPDLSSVEHTGNPDNPLEMITEIRLTRIKSFSKL